MEEPKVKSNLKSNGLRGVLLAGTIISGFAIAMPAIAQEAKNTETVVVTGSRIPQPNLSSVSPITMVDAKEIRSQGVTRIEDLTNSLPQVSAGQSSGVSNGASGTATVDLRDLAPPRTLVLINGRRLMPGDPSSSAADLNAIPDILVKRVEVLTGGASATYGADAVAGVVNFIMDTKFTGLKIDAQTSWYQHDNRNKITPPLLDARAKAGFSGFDYPTGNVSDGKTNNFGIAFGTDFSEDRGHMTAYLGYRKIEPVLQSDRDYSACTIQNTSSFVPANQALQCGGSATSTPGNVILFDSGTSTFFQIGANRTLEPGLTRYNFAPTNYFQRPDERYTGGFFAEYKVSDKITAYGEFNFMDDRTVAQIAPSGDFGNTLTVNCDSPLLSEQQKSIVCDGENLINGFLGSYPLTTVSNADDPEAAPINFIDPTTGATYNKGFFQLLRRNVEGGPRRADLQHTEYRSVFGAKGQINDTWSFDTYLQFGRTNYAQTYTNEFSVARLNNALDVVTGPGGKPVCRSVLTGADPSCVPYDVFGNNVTPEAVAYLNASGFQRGIVQEQVLNGSLTADMGKYGLKSSLADDGVSINFGAEYRRESLDLMVDRAFSTGDLTGQGAATLPISGNYHVSEYFGEFQAPIIQGRGVDLLAFNGGYRYSSYKVSNGNSFGTDTYKLGAEFAAVKDLRLRASYNRAVRAPNIQELFAVQNVALDGSTDPCSGKTLTAADTGCLLQGLKVGQKVAGNPAGQYNGLIGGNPNLTPETADTITFGFVAQPRMIPRFALSVDYFNIDVKDAIRGFGADAIVTECVNNKTQIACDLIHRNPATGSLWLTSDGYITDILHNVGGIKTVGADVNASYSYKFEKLGKLSLNLVGTYVSKYEIDNGLSKPYDCAGYYGVTCGVPAPKWKHKARMNLSMPNGLDISANWRYAGEVKVDYTSSNPSLSGSYFNFGSTLKAQNYFDLSGSYSINKNANIRAGINNILDKTPPLVTSGNGAVGASACPTGSCNGNTWPGAYDVLGRYIYVGATLNF